MGARATSRIVAGLVFAAAAGAACDREPRGEPSPRIQELLSGGEPVVLRLPDGDTLHLSHPVVEFYEQRGYRQAWTDYDELLDRGAALVQTMRSSERDGLDPETYRYSTAVRVLRRVAEDSIPEEREPARMADVDLALSEVFARYAHHLAGGTVDPKSGGLDWNIERDTADVLPLLRRLAAERVEPDEVVAALRPTAPEYGRMMDALARYRAIEAAGGWPEVPEATPSEEGERGPGVVTLRRRLLMEGDPEEVRLVRLGGEASDRMDEHLREAIARFQWRYGIEDDGALGPATLAEMNVPVAERILEIRLNLDRWRWLPRDLGDLYVLVNVAGYQLEVVEEDSVIESMRVVVGQQAWSTPIFRDTMEYAVFNPYWNVPNGIFEEEIAPAIARDPYYLARNDMEMVDGRVRQRPGPKNPLGQVKFLFPNGYDVYLHDTPAGHLFSESSRAFSHGCIRLERPLDLAKLVLSKATSRSADAVPGLLAGDSEKWVKLDRPIPVYILYFTVWVRPDGTVRFHEDIYERDRKLAPEARAKLERVAVRE